MAVNGHGVDIEQVIFNAKEQGIELRNIAVFYEGLTDAEKQVMQEHDLITHDNGNIAIARFTAVGEALFPDKVKGVHCLAS